MKIHLVNFRCYEDKIFDFGDNGLVLISACSGAGKSTIMAAIQFALFGTGTKVTSYGKTSCKVEIEFENMKIVRTKRPNRLVLNDEYEDAIAQEMINKMFGDTFDVTGYISQNALNSFIIMSPTEKLEFLEKFAFKDINLTEIKTRSKSLVSQRNDELNKAITQLEMTNNIISELKEPEKIDFPIKAKKSLYEKIKRNEEVKSKNCDTLIKKSKKIIDIAQKELSDILVLETFLNNKNENIDDIINAFNNFSIEESNITYIGDDKLKEYKERLKNILNHKELIKLEDTYEKDLNKLNKLKESEINKTIDEINKIKSNLWIEYTKNEINETILSTKESLKDAKKITFLKKQLKDYTDINDEIILNKKNNLEEIKILLEKDKIIYNNFKESKTIHSCPSCKVKLKYINNSLQLTETKNDLDDFKNIKEIETNIKKYSNQIEILNIEIPKLENKLENKNKLQKQIEDISDLYEDILDENNITDDLEYLQNYLKLQNSNENKLNNLQKYIDNNHFPIYYELEKDLKNLENKIKSLKEEKDFKDEILSEEELRNIIIKEEKNKDVLDKIKLNKKKIEDDKNKFMKQLENKKNEHITKYKEIRTQNIVENIINENKLNIDNLEKQKIEHISNLDKIEKYYNYIKEKESYDTWLNKKKNLENEIVDCRNKYSSALLLKDKILEAESIALANIIDSINIHAQVYLDNFFVDTPIVVRLLPFKETKKTNKPQINVEILYKDMECDLNMLSGGELSRVILAFTLALGEMFNTPILLLDESTASLDQEATSIVFDAIKENFKGKLVLIIAHQIIQGVFDKIIKL